MQNPKPAPTGLKSKKKHSHIFGSAKEKDFVIENMAMLLSSGLSLTAAIEAVKMEIKSKILKERLDEVLASIDAGNNLWRSLEASELFSADIISLVKIGEESGRLADNLQVIAIQQQKSRTFRSRLRSAMAYPLFVLSLTVFIGVGMAWFILPNLANVLSNLRIKLPLITRILITVGLFLKEHGKIAVPLFLVAFSLVVYMLFINPKTQHIGRRLLTKLPGVKQLIRDVELARFGFITGTLLKSGLTVTQSLDSLISSTTDLTYKRFYTRLKDDITAGNSFQKSFALQKDSHNFLPATLQQIVIAAEQSGNLAPSLLTIGARYEEKSEISSKNLTTLLEPILLFVVWIGVLFIALAIILPIYNLIGGLNS